MGEYSNLAGNLKTNLHSQEDLLLIEIFCLKTLNYNLTRYTAKQYYDLFCHIGFIFLDENILIENNSIQSIYDLGSKILKDFIHHYESTQYYNYILAFSTVVFIRENFINLEENIYNTRIKLLESILKIKTESYFICKDNIKKLINVKIIIDKNFINENYSKIKNFKIKSPEKRFLNCDDLNKMNMNNLNNENSNPSKIKLQNKNFEKLSSLNNLNNSENKSNFIF